jgi:hypothetical protein
MKLATKASSYKALSLGTFCLLIAFFFSACTGPPTKFTIDGPYPVYKSPVKPDDLSFETEQEMQDYAAAVCKKHRLGKLKKGDMPPNDFTSDGCSLSPDGNWVSCCIEHDISYWCGGTKQDRTDADNNLEQCIAKKGHPVYGWVANNLGVQTGGAPFWPTTFRWGYGWPYPYKYDPEK